MYATKDKRKNRTTKPLKTTQTSPPTEHTLVFLRREKCLSGSYGELKKQSLTCSSPTKYADTDENQTLSPQYGVCGGY